MPKKQAFELRNEPDACPTLEIELGPKGEGVGSWVPEMKHTLLAKLLGGTRGAWAKWPRRVLIDPFCGPGRIQVKGETFTRDGGAVVAWRQSVAGAAPFTQVLVGDIDGTRSAACHARLVAAGAPAEQFAGPALMTVPQMLARVPLGSLALAYLDPYNLELLSFEIIRALAAHKSIDLLVHFSSMDLHRNVDLEFDPERDRFADAAPGWREQLKGTSKPQLPAAFFAYWCSKVRALGFTFSKEMPLIRGDKNEPLYRLVFFSRHDLPKKIWDDVAKGPNRTLF